MENTNLVAGCVVLLSGQVPALILPNNHLLTIVFKKNNSMHYQYARREPINYDEMDITLLDEEQIKALPPEIKLAMEAALEAIQVENSVLGVFV